MVAGFLKDHPLFAIIGAIGTTAGIVYGVLGLIDSEHPWVEDEKICGTSEVAVQTHRWRECENPNKVTGYRYSETVSKSSGRVDGGSDQGTWCAQVMREKEAAVGQSIVWAKPRSSEERNRNWKQHVTYKYHCTIDAKWGPIYKIERWEGCGEASPEIERRPMACYDQSKTIGWRWKWQ